MNEQLKKIAEQAGIFRPKEFYQHIDALQLEKFAELIVQECSDLVDNVIEQGSPPNLTLGEQLNEYFGVK